MKKLILSTIALIPVLLFAAAPTDTNMLPGFLKSSGTNAIGKIPYVITNAAQSGGAWVLTNIFSLIGGSGGTNLLDTNAVFQIVTNHLPWFNIVDFGAVGDASKLNQTNIQNAINAAEAAGGGVVYVPKGTFHIGVTIPLSKTNMFAEGFNSILTISSNNVIMMGDGMGQSIIKLAQNSGTLRNLMAIGGVVNVSGDHITNRIATTNNMILGVTIDGGSMSTVYDMFQCYFTYNTHFRHLQLINCVGDAIDCQYGGEIYVDDVQTRNVAVNSLSLQNPYVRVTNCRFLSGGTSGFCIDTFEGRVILDNVYIEDCPKLLRNTFSEIHAYNCIFFPTNSASGTTNMVLDYNAFFYNCDLQSKSIETSTYFAKIDTNRTVKFVNCTVRAKPLLLIDNAAEVLIDSCDIQSPQNSVTILFKGGAGSYMIKNSTFNHTVFGYAFRCQNNGESASGVKIINNLLDGGSLYTDSVNASGWYIANNTFFNGSKLALWDCSLVNVVDNVFDSSSQGLDLIASGNYIKGNRINSLNYLGLGTVANVFHDNYILSTNGAFASASMAASTIGVHNVRDGGGLTNISGTNINIVGGGNVNITTNTSTGQITINSTAGGDSLWATNAAVGYITNKNYGFGVKVDGTHFDTNQIYFFETSGPGARFAMSHSSFYGSGFSIDRDGEANTFGLVIPNASNWFQASRIAVTPIMEITTNNMTIFGSNVTVRSSFTNTPNIGASYRLAVWDANGLLTSGSPTNAILGGVATNAIINMDGFGTNTWLTNFIALQGTNIYTTNLLVSGTQTNGFLGGDNYVLVMVDNNGRLMKSFATNVFAFVGDVLWGTNTVNGSITNRNYLYAIKWAGGLGTLDNAGGATFSNNVIVGANTALGALGDILAANGGFYININGDIQTVQDIDADGRIATINVFHGNASGVSNAVDIIAGSGITVDTNTPRAFTINTGPSAWIAGLAYEMYYEPWGLGNHVTDIGALSWTAQSAGAGGGGQSVSNAPGHFGLTTISTSTSANSIHSLFNSSTLNAKPSIPPLNATIGWTNTWIWRIVNTNSLKAYLCLQAGNFTQSALENGIGIMLNTTNNNQIMGFCASSSATTTTNLGTVQNNTWYTNRFGSTSSGVIFFSLQDGTMGHINSNVPTTGLTPSASLVKTEAGTAAFLDLDDYIGVYTRQ